MLKTIIYTFGRRVGLYKINMMEGQVGMMHEADDGLHGSAGENKIQRGTSRIANINRTLPFNKIDMSEREPKKLKSSPI